MIAGAILYGTGIFIASLLGSLMMFAPFSDTDAGEEIQKRRGAKLILLSPVWPVLALIGIKLLWSKAKSTLKEEE